MSEKTSADTVPGLGFKDKDKALETLKNLEGRDPDYQKLAIKGLIGRAKRTLTLTKAEDKLQNINDAVKVFEDWLKDFEKLDLGKQNKAYLPLSIIELLLPLKKQYNINDEKSSTFLKAYRSVDGDYKHLRTVPSGEDLPTWDIVRNSVLKKLVKSVEDNKSELWKDDLPTKEHMELIIWGYSPEATKIKKNLPKLESKLGHDDEDSSSDEKVETKKAYDKKKRESKDNKNFKRKSDTSSSSTSDEESPKKKSRK